MKREENKLLSGIVMEKVGMMMWYLSRLSEVTKAKDFNGF